MNNKNKIMEHLNQSIKLNPNYPYSYIGLAKYYQNIGELAIALDKINIGINIEISTFSAIENQLNNTKNIQEINIKMLELEKSTKRLSDFNLKKAEILIEDNNHKNAKLALLKSIKLNPISSKSYYLLYRIEKNKQKANKYLEVAIKIDPEYSIV